MDRPAAVQLIQDTFQNRFDRNTFTFFIKNLLNRLDESNFVYRGDLVPDAYKPYVHSLERIGKYEDPKGNKIDVLIVQLKERNLPGTG